VKARIQRWGNSLALRIPKSFAADANLRQESMVEITFADGKIVVTPIEAPVLSLETLLRGVTPENLHDETEFGPAVGTEVW
jgi:antitoxin MazE